MTATNSAAQVSTNWKTGWMPCSSRIAEISWALISRAVPSCESEYPSTLASLRSSGVKVAPLSWFSKSTSSFMFSRNQGSILVASKISSTDQPTRSAIRSARSLSQLGTRSLVVSASLSV